MHHKHEQYVDKLKIANPTVIPLEKYKGSHIKIKSGCLVCKHKWDRAPVNLLRGTRGCPKCGRVKQAKSSTKTHEQYVAELKIANPTVIPLEKYKGNQIKSKHKCSVCSHKWDVMPNSLLSGNGCPPCGIVKRNKSSTKTHEQYVAELKIANPTVLPLEKYKRKRTKSKHRCLVCEHKWDVLPGNLLGGKGGCPKCGQVKRHKSLTRTHKEYVAELKIANPTVIFLEKYKSGHIKLKHKCLNCEHKWGVLATSLLNGIGCPKCGSIEGGKKIAKTHEQYVAELKIANPTVLPLEKYKGNHIKLKHRCLVCEHKWDPTPANLLQGSRCANCHILLTAPCVLYILKYPDFIKLGVTTDDVKRRLRDIKYDSDYIGKIHKVYGGVDRVEAKEFEKSLIKKFKPLQFIPNIKFGGWTECFIKKCLPSLIRAVENNKKFKPMELV